MRLDCLNLSLSLFALAATRCLRFSIPFQSAVSRVHAHVGVSALLTLPEDTEDAGDPLQRLWRTMTANRHCTPCGGEAP